MQQWENKMDIRAECIGSLAFDQFCSGSLANGPRWRSWICGTDSFRLGPCAGSLVPLQYSMEFHCLGFPHHFKNEFHMSHNVPLHFFGSCPLLSNVFFVFFWTWAIYLKHLEAIICGFLTTWLPTKLLQVQGFWLRVFDICFATMIRRITVALDLTQLSHACCVSKHYILPFVEFGMHTWYPYILSLISPNFTNYFPSNLTNHLPQLWRSLRWKIILSLGLCALQGQESARFRGAELVPTLSMINWFSRRCNGEEIGTVAWWSWWQPQKEEHVKRRQ